MRKLAENHPLVLDANHRAPEFQCRVVVAVHCAVQIIFVFHNRARSLRGLGTLVADGSIEKQAASQCLAGVCPVTPIAKVHARNGTEELLGNGHQVTEAKCVLEDMTVKEAVSTPQVHIRRLLCLAEGVKGAELRNVV